MTVLTRLSYSIILLLMLNSAYALSTAFCLAGTSCGTSSFSLSSSSSYYSDYGLHNPRIDFTMDEKSSFKITHNSSVLTFELNNSITYWNGSETLTASFDWIPNVLYGVRYFNSSDDLAGINITIGDNITKLLNFSIPNIKSTCSSTGSPNCSYNFLNISAVNNVTGYKDYESYYYDDTIPLCGDSCIFDIYTFNSFADGSAIFVNNLDGATTLTNFNYSYVPMLINTLQNCSLFVNDGLNITNSTTVTNNRINRFNVTLSNAVYNMSVECYDITPTRFITSNKQLIVDNVAPNVTNITSDKTSYLDNENAVLTMNCTDDNIRTVYFEYYIDGVYQSTQSMSLLSGNQYRATLALSSGIYNVSNAYCADYSTTTATNNSIQFTVTHQGDSGGGGGGGGLTSTFAGFGNFSIYPSQNITYTAVKGFSTTDEFRIVNEDIKDIGVRVVFNERKSTQAIKAWFSFLNTDRLDLNFTIESTEGLTNPFVYVRYQIEIPENVVLSNSQNYVVVLDVISARKSVPILITLKQSDSAFTKFLRFLSQKLYTYSNSFNTVALNDTTNQEITKTNNIEFSIRMWHILLFAGIVVSILIARKRR